MTFYHEFFNAKLKDNSKVPFLPASFDIHLTGALRYRALVAIFPASTLRVNVSRSSLHQTWN